jgi:hypothetical protein
VRVSQSKSLGVVVVVAAMFAAPACAVQSADQSVAGTSLPVIEGEADAPAVTPSSGPRPTDVASRPIDAVVAPTTRSPSVTTPPSVGSATTTRLPRWPCRLTSLEIDRLVVLGNSTDYTFEADELIKQVAWPERLTDSPFADVIADVLVQNEAQRGQTMGDWPTWGADASFYMRDHARNVVREIPLSAMSSTLFLVAPSFIDLQVNGYDVQRALDDLFVVISELAGAGLQWVVLPMNSVSTTLDQKYPTLNIAIEEFNRELNTNALIHFPLPRSPLSGEAGSGGQPQFFDDFPGVNPKGEFVGADGLHPDEEGQKLKAEVVLGVLRSLVADTYPTADCAV